MDPDETIHYYCEECLRTNSAINQSKIRVDPSLVVEGKRKLMITKDKLEAKSIYL
jgi:hypothetical protein